MIQRLRAGFCWSRCLPCLALIAVSLASCSMVTEGKAVTSPPDSAFFFAGDVPVYGHPVTGDDVARLAYVRAMRRIDVCGLLRGAALAKVGELVSVGPTLAYDECDAEVKVSGGGQRFLNVSIATSPRDPPSMCGVTMPLPLSGLPGAPAVPTGMQPTVWVELVVDTDCKLESRVGDGLRARLTTGALPPRDATALYQSPLAERDPCEVVKVLDDVRAWDVFGLGPYSCRLKLNGNRIVVTLRPQFVDARRTECTAFEFVGPPMQRNVIGVGYVRPGDVDVRPAVVVADIDGANCGSLADIAAKAASVYR